MRDPEKTRRALLESAYYVVYRQGFRAASISEIVSRARVTQGAFFHYFPAKSDLGYALVDEIQMEMMLDRWTKPLAAYKNPVQGMIARFRKNMEDLSEEDMALGCPLNNLTQEMSSIDPVFRDKLRGVLTAWIGETEKHLKRAQEGGYIRPDVDVKSAANFIVMAEEGSAALVKNLGGRNLYWSLYESFRNYLISLTPDRKAPTEE